MRAKQNDQAESDLPKLAAPARRALAGAGIQRLEHWVSKHCGFAGWDAVE